MVRAEAPSLTSYNDKADEFSLSVPASKLNIWHAHQAY